MKLSSASPATDCICHGTGIIVPPPASRYPDPSTAVVAHPYTIACACSPTPGAILLGNYHALALASAAGLVAWVDEPMVPDVEALWRAGISTSGSCKGSLTAPAPRYIIVDPAAAPQAHALLPWVTSARKLLTGTALCGNADTRPPPII